MRIPNIYVQQALALEQSIALEDSAAQHVAKALRMKSGYKLVLFNGDGFFYPSTITDVSKKQVSVHVDEQLEANSESPLHTHIGQTISRGDRMDYAIQKATELGANEISPLFSERCEVKLNPERQAKRQAHWQQVAISAAEQCGRACVPVIHPPVDISSWINTLDEATTKLVLHHRDTQNLSTLPQPKSVALLIGPEGGLSEQEITEAQTKQFIACTLGPRVLRTETAPITSLSVLQWLWGDFNAPNS